MMDEDKVQWSYQSTLSMEELNATQNNRADLERFMQILQSQQQQNNQPKKQSFEWAITPKKTSPIQQSEQCEISNFDKSNQIISQQQRTPLYESSNVDGSGITAGAIIVNSDDRRDLEQLSYMEKTPSVCRVKKRVQGGETMQSLADLLQNFAQHSGVQPVNVADGEAVDAGMMMEDVVDPELEMLLSQYDQRQQRLQIAIPSAERQLMPTTSELPSPTDFEMLDPTLEMVLSQYDRF